MLYGFDSQGNDLENFPRFLTDAGSSSLLAIDKEETIYGIFERTIRAFDSTGNQKWSFDLAGSYGNHFALGKNGILEIPGEKLIVLKIAP